MTRDLAIAAEMRRIYPNIDIAWIAGSPASEVLSSAGERLVPEQVKYRGETDLAEAVARNGRLNLTVYVYRALNAWFHNAFLIGRVASRGEFDIIVGNETYEIPVTNFFGFHVLPPIPFVMMYDFWGMEVTSGNVFEKFGAWMLNLVGHRNGVCMHVSSTSPQDMADAIKANLGVKVSYPEIPVSGAQLAAKRILEHAGIKDLL